MMAAAYAAVISLVHLMDQIQLYHDRHPIFLEEQQGQLESLRKDVVLLQDFLESYSREDNIVVEYLESLIANVAYAAEDIIESQVVDDVHSRCENFEKKSPNLLSHVKRDMKDSVKKETMRIKEKRRLTHHSHLINHVNQNTYHFSYGLQKVTQEIDVIKEEIMKLQENKIVVVHQHQDREHEAFRRHPPRRESVIVGQDDLIQFMGKVIGGNSHLLVLPITGMGGIGKTTLANAVYVNWIIMEYFDVRCWVTLSQEYNLREILLGLLHEIGCDTGQNELESLDEFHQLGEELYKHLYGRRYMIIIDDMWGIEPWNELRKFLPDVSNGSRIIVTTRLSNLANDIGSSNVHKMNLLNESKSWDLLCRKVFLQERCPSEFDEVGQQIAKNCKGLPLSISVIAGLLANSKMTQESWEYVANYTSTIIHLEDDECCLKILSMSYLHLPTYLKPCFLHFGTFPEDKNIRVSKLIKLWVAEGFLRQPIAESLEEVAENCVKDLIDRNLIFVGEWGSTGKVKYCKIHDLVRDLCLREAQKEMFICVNMVRNPNVSQNLDRQRRIVLHHQFSNDEPSFKISKALLSASLARSLTCNSHLGPRARTIDPVDHRPTLNFRLLRILDVVDEYSMEDVFRLVNSRYICAYLATYNFGKIPSSICMLWNLQTLVVENDNVDMTAPPEIWEMTQLRHILISVVELPDPLSSQSNCMLENLQTLSEVSGLTWTEETLRRIPNIKKLKMKYHDMPSSQSPCLNNVVRLNKLESLVCTFPFGGDCFGRDALIRDLDFPKSLKKLTLWRTEFYWEDIATKIGSLPNLEKLKLVYCPAGEEWRPVEGQFLRLKYLEICCAYDLVNWIAEGTSFPCLEQLVLDDLSMLEEVPLGFADIVTLQLIQLYSCSRSSVASAKEILTEQQNWGNEDFQLWVDQKPVVYSAGGGGEGEDGSSVAMGNIQTEKR